MGSAATSRQAYINSEPGVETGDVDYITKATSGAGSTGQTTKNPTATFTNFAGLSNMSGAGFLRILIVDPLTGAQVMKARIPLLTDA